LGNAKKSWAWFCLIIGTITLLLGVNGMPIGLLVLSGVVTACGLNNVLRGDRAYARQAHETADGTHTTLRTEEQKLSGPGAPTL